MWADTDTEHQWQNRKSACFAWESCLEAGVMSVYVSSQQSRPPPMSQHWGRERLPWRPVKAHTWLRPSTRHGGRVASGSAGVNICYSEENREFWKQKENSFNILKNAVFITSWPVDTILAPAAWGISAWPPDGDTGAAWWLWLHWLGPGLQVRSVTLGPDKRRPVGSRRWVCLATPVQGEDWGVWTAISGAPVGEEGGTQWAVRRGGAHYIRGSAKYQGHHTHIFRYRHTRYEIML